MLDVCALLSARHGSVTRQHQRVVVCPVAKQLRPALRGISVTGEVQRPQTHHTISQARRCSAIARADVDSKAAAMMMKDSTRPSNGAARRRSTSALDTTVYENIPDACRSGLPDVEACTLDFNDEDDSDYIARSASLPAKLKKSAAVGDQDLVLSEAWNRGRWLLGLLILQSLSSFVLNRCVSSLRHAQC
jgi:hypothetical protein